jgi:hypothetical protein
MNVGWLSERRAIVLYPKTTRQTLIHTTISQLGFRVAYKNVPLCTEGRNHCLDLLSIRTRCDCCLLVHPQITEKHHHIYSMTVAISSPHKEWWVPKLWTAWSAEKKSTAKNQSHVMFRRTSTSNHVGDRVDNKKPEESLLTTVSCIHSLRQVPLIANVDRMNTVSQSWRVKSSN